MSKWEVIDCGVAATVHLDHRDLFVAIIACGFDTEERPSFRAPTFDQALALARAECERRNTEPRTFHGHWVEAATMAEADDAGFRELDGRRVPLAYRSDGKQIDVSLPDDDHTGPGRHWFWVKRIESKPKPMEPTEADVERLAMVLSDEADRSAFGDWRSLAHAAFREILK